MNFDLLLIDKNNSDSISNQIVNLILKNIEQGYLNYKDKLPTEREFSDILNVSRGTIKNSYKKLESNGVIETIQGSGSYVLINDEFIKQINIKKSSEIVDIAIYELKKIGCNDKMIMNLVQNSLNKESKKSIAIAVIYDTLEFLIDFKNQISELNNTKTSVFILDSIINDNNPENMMNSYDIIAVPSSCYKKILNIIPNLKDKIIEAAVSASFFTLTKLANLPQNSRIGVICRTNLFLSTVKETLFSYGFLGNNIQSFFEMDYTLETYFPGGINVLISFSDAHIFTNPLFEKRNKELVQKGGRIIKFKYEIEKGTLIYIEDKINQLLTKQN